ncbi:(2Fe-2S)-binding protein [Amycolatopsis minnesotensis]|uniref:(2Fe-2S)-binding protein n=1 Tax=Amycolatopsis minnesotensis TaxID=337894 RepID=A0ABP5DSQ6_9PSEU
MPPAVAATGEHRLRVNGTERTTSITPSATLLDTLRERLGLFGTKKGCDHGQCGACTVLVDGRRTLSCLVLAATQQDREITTIEGLARPDGSPHPLQEAFAARDAFQCGYCTPGQIMSAAGLANEGWPPDDDGIREAMSGNLCRCGAYNTIVAAIRDVRDGTGA